jgi:hypothetical protein
MKRRVKYLIGALAYAVAGLCRAIGSLSCRVAHIGAVLQDDFLRVRRHP